VRPTPPQARANPQPLGAKNCDHLPAAGLRASALDPACPRPLCLRMRTACGLTPHARARSSLGAKLSPMRRAFAAYRGNAGSRAQARVNEKPPAAAGRPAAPARPCSGRDCPPRPASLPPLMQTRAIPQPPGGKNPENSPAAGLTPPPLDTATVSGSSVYACSRPAG
jgi:hypothetical protein